MIWKIRKAGTPSNTVHFVLVPRTSWMYVLRAVTYSSGISE